jgi:hypothetical protein
MSDGQWAIVELMGHKVVAGLASKDEMLGKPMLRVDVPATKDYPAFTQMFGESAIYCVTFVSEPVALAAAEQCHANPVAIYVPDLAELAELRAENKRLVQKALPQPGADEHLPYEVTESRQRTMQRWVTEDREQKGY